MRRSAALLLLVLFSRPGYGDDFHGRIDTLGAFYPALSTAEARVRLFAGAEATFRGDWLVVVSACADGMGGTNDRGTPRSAYAAAVLRLQETYLERRGQRVEVRVGLSNVAWGVLDELSPQDVINPIDISRFVLEGRADARLPVPLARVRLFLPAELTVEALLVPYARRGTFDELAETRSPFAPAGLGTLPESDLPVRASTMEGGFRFRGTTGGVDWGTSVYRDRVDFDRYLLSPAGLMASRPPRWMLAGDFETARGDWVLRGEGAFYIDDPLQATSPPLVVTRTTFQGGLGADRRVGETTLFLNALYRHVPDDPRLDADDEVSAVAGLSHDFSRGTQNIKVFGLWNASAGSAFVRTIWSAELVENVRLEAGGGAFLGEGGQTLGLLADSDFLVTRLRVYF